MASLWPEPAEDQLNGEGVTLQSVTKGLKITAENELLNMKEILTKSALGTREILVQIFIN